MTKSLFSLRSEDQLGLGVDEHGVKGGKELESDEDSEDEHNEMIPMKAQLTRNLANMMTNGYQDPTMRATTIKRKITRKLDPLKIVKVKMTAKKKLLRSSETIMKEILIAQLVARTSTVTKLPLIKMKTRSPQCTSLLIYES